MVELLANSGDPDQTPRNAVSDQVCTACRGLQSSMGKNWKSANTKKLRAQAVSLFVTEERANLTLVLLNKLRCHAHF